MRLATLRQPAGPAERHPRPTLQRRVLADLQAHPDSAAMDVALRLDLRRWQVSMALQRLRAAGLVYTTGFASATRWSTYTHPGVAP